MALLSQGRTAAAQCGLFTYKSVPVIFEPPCIFPSTPITFKWSPYLTFMYPRRYILIANGSAIKIADLNMYQTSFIPLYYGQSCKIWELRRNPSTESCLFISRVYIHPFNTAVRSAGEDKNKACTWKMRNLQKYWSETHKEMEHFVDLGLKQRLFNL